MARSMQEDEVDDDYDENEIIELDSQTDYMSKSVSFNSIIIITKILIGQGFVEYKRCAGYKSSTVIIRIVCITGHN